VTKTQGDVRACLNTLQFIRRRAVRVTAALVASAQVGQKDIEMNLLDICSSALAYPEKALGTMSAAGAGDDSERVLQTMYDNVLSVPLAGGISRAVDMYDWLALADFTSTAMRRGNAFTLQRYTSIAAAGVAQCATGGSRPRITVSKADWELRQRIAGAEHVANAALAAVPPNLRPFLTAQSVRVSVS
jgi:hypothetical protein